MMSLTKREEFCSNGYNWHLSRVFFLSGWGKMVVQGHQCCVSQQNKRGNGMFKLKYIGKLVK